MSSRANQQKNKFIAIDAINKGPVRLDMAFAKTAEFTCEIVIPVFWREGFQICKLFDNIIQQL